ncbi:helix loop helix domain [Rhizoctonia solani]|uniref:Helix loop helix domain n=1 Tax=Rhizoctonia solani TaxID=456999 RepID=A0A8H7IKH9_9AGAM|nr:helix loop helix domain [Rhizoctonia solani]
MQHHRPLGHRHYYYPNTSGQLYARPRPAPPHFHPQQQQQQQQQHAMSNALLSSAEESNIFGFLDAFDWDLDESVGAGMPAFDSGTSMPSAVAAGPEAPQIAMDVDPFFGEAQRQSALVPFGVAHHSPPPTPSLSIRTSPDEGLVSGGLLTPGASTPTNSRTPKPLLTQPQKRLNHIMSEQKRRNAIKEGYETLAMLLSPGDVSLKLAELASPEKKAQAAVMASEVRTPTLRNGHRGLMYFAWKQFGYTGRPGRARGSGKNGKAKKMGKGKSGMLFRAVEFCKWLQQDVDALRIEIERLEGARPYNSGPNRSPNTQPQ